MFTKLLVAAVTRDKDNFFDGSRKKKRLPVSTTTWSPLNGGGREKKLRQKHMSSQFKCRAKRSVVDMALAVHMKSGRKTVRSSLIV